ncbi:MAG: efflux RND transporter permease subunit [Planctomycetaceae bacterium]|nr:efflux RND transporter permease subunit [Planctomycetaceae bacterium]
MYALIDFCVRERLLVGALIVATFLLGWYSVEQVPIDAIPNVGENQVIVIADWPGRSPKDVEDQLTYPISVAMQTVPGSQSVRGKSMFGFSFVQVTFADGVDFYWARSRVAERLTAISNSLPDNVVPTLAPDATALGQIYYYVLQAPAGMDLAELRSKQDYFIKYALQSVDGVAEVASIGGYVKQYQVDVNSEKLRFHGISLNDVIESIRNSNIDVGAKVVDEGGLEYLVRGKGFLGANRTEEETIEQIGQAVIETRGGTPIRVQDVAWVQVGPALRTGALDLNGNEAVGGVVVMRFGENPLAVIERLQQKINLLEADLQGIKIVGIYDRTELIHETIATLTDALIEETLITIAVMVLFLLHFRASLIVAITLPMAVLMSFIAMRFFGVDANIMSLAGIAIAIGTMVDMGIIVLENVYVALTTWEREGQVGGEPERVNVIRRASSEVIPAVMTAVSTTIVSFLPVFFLTGRDGRLFAPMAWTKSFALAASLLVAVIAVPMLCRIFLRSNRWSSVKSMAVIATLAGLSSGITYFVWGPRLEHWTGRNADVFAAIAAVAGGLLGHWICHERLRELDENPVSRFVVWLYAGRLRLALRHKLVMLSLPTIVMLAGLVAWVGAGNVLRPVERFAEIMGARLEDLPGYSELKSSVPPLKSSDWIALDEGSWFYMPSLYPAATFSQTFEVLQKQDVLIKQIPEVANVLGKIGRAESALDPAPATMIETYVMLKPRSEWRPGITSRDIWDEINRVATVTGVTPASALQPIEGRVVMLQAGIRATMAVRIYGEKLDDLASASLAIAEHLKTNALVNRNTVSPDIVLGKPYIEFEVDREESARYGMSTMMVNEIVAAGLGGMDVTTTVEGRERYAVQVRYERSTRESLEDLGRLEVVTPPGSVVPLERLTKIQTIWGPMSINSEDARLVAHVAFMPSGVTGPVETAQQLLEQLQADRVAGKLQLPAANFELQMVGSFQNQVEANQRLMWIIPLVILINLLLHYLHFRDLPQSLMVFSGIPISAGGGMLAVALTGIPMNTAMWIGFIALFGLAADDGIVMMTYIRDELQKHHWRTVQELREIIFQAGLKRVRPCVMTTVTTLVALVPILVSDGRGADVAKAMAIPILGGMLVEPFATFVVPTLYCWYLEWTGAKPSVQVIEQSLMS